MGVKASIERCAALTRQELDTWSRIQDEDPDLASPFFCPEFAAAVDAARGDVYVAVLEESGKIVGFFPFHRNTLAAGWPVGRKLSDSHGVIIERRVSWTARELLRTSRLKTWEFDHLIASQRPFEGFSWARRSSPCIALERGFDAYANSRAEAGSQLIRQAFRKLRRLEREVGPVRFEPHVRDPRALRTLVRWKSDQYARTGVVNVFSFRWVEEVLERVHSMESKAFAGPLSVLYVGDEIASAHLGLRSSSVWHWWFPSYDPRLARYSPGILLLLKLAESAASGGIARLDLGKGDARYKESLMTGAAPLLEGRVELVSIAALSSRVGGRAYRLLDRTPLTRHAYRWRMRRRFR